MRAHLITETVPGRFGCHELLCTNGSELARTQEMAQELATARRRMLDHYLHSAHAADSVLMPSRDRVRLRPHTADVTVQRFTEQVGAADWLDTHRSVLLAAIDQDAWHGSGEHSWQLATLLELYLGRSGRRQEQLGAQTSAAGAAQRLGDLRGLRRLPCQPAPALRRGP